MARLILFNKPFGVLTKFTDAAGRETLAAHLPIPGVFPAGRLDRDSEGLLLLTDDGALQHRLSDPRWKLPKTYWAQVEGEPDESALERLRRGIVLDGQRTRPAQARRIPEPALWPREPPIRFRKTVPTAWVELVLTEGRNRQVRRMTAAVGHPTLRLVRAAIGPYTLAGLACGQWREVPSDRVLKFGGDLEAERGRGGDRRARRPVPAGGGRGRRGTRAQPARRPSR